MISNQRKIYIDGLKCVAIFIVFLTHFVTYFESAYLRLWSEPPVAYLLRGMTGKFGVAILAVCLGYFAYGSREKNASIYIVRRYFYFFISGLFINSLIAVLSYFQVCLFDNGFPAISLFITTKVVLKESICLGYRIYPTFWCMFAFCFGSVTAYLNGRAEIKTFGILVQMLLFWLSGQIWVTICLMGCLCNCCLNNKTAGKLLAIRPVRVVLILFVFIAVLDEGGNIPQFWNGIRAMMIILALEESSLLQKALSVRALSSTGKNVMSVFLLHMPVLIILGDWLLHKTSGFDYKYSFFISLISCWCMTALLAYPLTMVLNQILSFFTKLLKKAASKLNYCLEISSGNTE